MTPEAYDSAIREAVTALNRLPGVRTTASCQGKRSPGETSSHADLAYVRFAAPVPLRIEEELIHRVGELSRVEPTAVYCRRPAWNGAFCARIEEAATAVASGEGGPDRGIRLGQREVRKRLLQHFETNPDEVPGICRRCRSLVSGTRHCDEATLELLPSGFEGLDGVLERFLENDPNPPDPRLVAREGARAIRSRILRGDFGATYRRDWRSFLRSELDRLLREDVRHHLARERHDGRNVDLIFEDDGLTFETD